MMSVENVFEQCVEATRAGELIERDSPNDKEFPFQNWFSKRLNAIDVAFDSPGRNAYPDFRLVHSPNGYELKGLAYPGRYKTYDSNSQIPRGEHNDRTLYYVFGRYPKSPDGDSYPLLDLVICHGGFLNVDSSYEHKNRNFKGFGSYGDIMVRDRKMYVAPTPYAIAEGTAHHRTLILPASHIPDRRFVDVGELIRYEVQENVVAYQFDLRSNKISTRSEPNPNAGREHRFRAWRLAGDHMRKVALQSSSVVLDEMQKAAALDESE